MDTKKEFGLFVKSLLIIFALAFFISPVKAEDAAAENPAVESKPILISTVNIYNAKIAKYDQEKSELKIFFDIYNREKAQPQIMYAVQLIKEENGKQYLVDEKVYDKVISLSENQSVSESIIYPVPDYLSGKYKARIEIMNTRIFTMAITSAGEVDLKAKTAQYLEVVGSSCYLTVEGEKSGTKYSLRQGVDIADNEKLIGHCEVVNHYQTAIDFMPSFETHFRTLSGEVVSDNQESQIAMRLGKNEKNFFSFVLPKALKPQAYDATLVLKGENIVSNKIAFHYVLHGLSATVQNIRLDKDYYTKGETVKASFYWTASADGFPGSRMERTSMDGVILEVEIKNCSKKVAQSLNGQSAILNLEIPIEKDCFNPQAVVIIKDNNGNILDQNSFSIKSENISENVNISQPAISAEKIGGIKKIVLAIILALTLISLGVIFIKKRNAGFLRIFLLAFLATTILGTGEARADMVAIGSCDDGACVENLYYNINQTTYEKGDDILSEAHIPSYTGCKNGNSPDVWADVFFKSVEADSEVDQLLNKGSYDSYSTPISTKAPIVAGNYNAIFPTKTYTRYCQGPFVDSISCPHSSGESSETCALWGVHGYGCYVYTLNKDFGDSLAIPYTVLTIGSGSATLRAQVAGKGWVSSNPLGIRCGDDDGTIVKNCFAVFKEDILVSLTAHPSIGVTAINWTGCAEGPKDPITGIADTCFVKTKKDSSEKVSVEFVGGGEYKLTVYNKSQNGGSGAILDDILLKKCTTADGICIWEYPADTSVELTPKPDAVSFFVPWEKSDNTCGCSGTGACFCLMDKDQMVSGIFDKSVCNGFSVTLVAVPISGCVPLAVNLTANLSGGTGPFTYKYTCFAGDSVKTDNDGDGKFVCNYGSAGLYEPNIVVIDSSGCIINSTVSVFVTAPNYRCVSPCDSSNCGDTVPKSCCDLNYCGGACDSSKCAGGCPDITCPACPKSSGWKEVAP